MIIRIKGRRHNIWGNLLSVLQSTDFNLINLETTFTKSEQKTPKMFNFKADPMHVQSLIDGGISAVNLANNHVLDYSEEGLLETLRTLKAAHIPYVGAGINVEEATSPAIIDSRGIKIGVIGCTDNEPSWKATNEQSGTFYVDIDDIQGIRQVISHIRKQVDLLILSIHWGPNMRERPSKHFQAFAHQLIDLGVDIIHGHSAHIFQGIEIYKGKLILYDTGDFVDDYAIDPILRNDRSFFFIIEANQQGLHTLRLIPVLITHYQVNKAEGETAGEILHRMQKLSEEFHTSLGIENNQLVKRWK